MRWSQQDKALMAGSTFWHDASGHHRRHRSHFPQKGSMNAPPRREFDHHGPTAVKASTIDSLPE
jgi:hypothetical protein